MIIKSLAMKGREVFNLSDHSSCKWFCPADETTGTLFKDAISGAEHDASKLDACYPDYDHTVTHDVTNAVSINTVTVNAEYLRLQNAGFPVLDCDKIIINMVVMRCLDKDTTKFPVGAVGGTYKAGSGCPTIDSRPGFSLSFQGSMHASARDDIGNTATTPNEAKALINGTDYICYVMHNGIANTITTKVFALDGTLVHSQSDASTLTGAMTPDAVTRIRGLALYTWQIYEFDSLPGDLDIGLQWIANQSVKHDVKSPYLPWSQ